MKLKITKGYLPNQTIGCRATLIPNDLTGAILAIEAGNSVANIKISDLVDFIQAQDVEEAKTNVTT